MNTFRKWSLRFLLYTGASVTLGIAKVISDRWILGPLKPIFREMFGSSPEGATTHAILSAIPILLIAFAILTVTIELDGRLIGRNKHPKEPENKLTTKPPSEPEQREDPPPEFTLKRFGVLVAIFGVLMLWLFFGADLIESAS
jgi:hypothetical protein